MTRLHKFMDLGWTLIGVAVLMASAVFVVMTFVRMLG